jgi:HSP20 family protein
MTFTSLIPWRRESENMPVRQEEEYPFLSLRREMDRLFDDFLTGWGWRTSSTMAERWNKFTPQLDISEVNDQIKITAELPGLDREDVSVNLTNDLLTISGEKKKETEEEGEDYYRSERTYGAFERSIRLPSEVNPDEVNAVFDKGILTITLPKMKEMETRKQIEVKGK